MDIELIKGSFKEVLSQELPSAVETAVKAETDALSKKVGDVETALADISKQMKFSGGDEESKKDLYAKTANYFKALVRKDEKAFGEAKAAFLNEGTDSEGGYLVPTEFSREVIRVAKEVGFARKYCRIIPMSTDTKDITSLVSGVTVFWKSEGAAYTASKPGFGRIQLIANKLTALVSGTNELIDDNQSNEEVFNLVRDLIAEAIAEFEDTQVLTGNGTAPNFQGVVGASGVVTAGYTLATPTYAETVAIKNSLAKKYRTGAVWVMNQDEFTKYEAMVDANGRPLLKESFKNDQSETIMLGYPVEVNDALADGKVLFGNFKYYLLGDRKSLVFEAGYATGGWESDVQSLKASERIAGKIALADAFVVATGA